MTLLVATALVAAGAAIGYSLGAATWFSYTDELISRDLTYWGSVDYHGQMTIWVLLGGGLLGGGLYVARLLAQAAALATARPSSLSWSTLGAATMHTTVLVATAAFALAWPPKAELMRFTSISEEWITTSGMFSSGQTITFGRAAGALWLLGGLAVAQALLWMLHARARHALRDAPVVAEAAVVAKLRPLIKPPLSGGRAVDDGPFRAAPRPVIAAVSTLALPERAPQTEQADAHDVDAPKLLR
jgi:hypothetical protein